ncbi:MAG: AAA family ATPase, partial [Proteobacteria bacterium]|nr:AAA family ATPase [Pseudomonadota bacterium]
MIYYSRFLVPYDSSFILLGPRGTGKSLWLKNHLPQAILIDLLDESLYQKYLAQPEAFANRMRLCKEGEWVIVDEIQRLPQLLNYIHKFIEERGIKFALCGSSARKLRRDGVNLLGGRLLLVNMFPFLPSEIGADFS